MTTWQQLAIPSTAALAEQISERLWALGACSTTFADQQDNPVFEPLPGETKLWHETVVIGLFTDDIDLAPIIAELQQDPLFNGQLSYQLSELVDQDWQRAWMDNFQPMRFGQRLWICPSWHAIPDVNAVNVLLDPGLAFGTGTHPTTAMCLQWLDSIDVTDKTIIDFGCGSGILAIAALKLGAKQAIGIDIDPQALQASLANAQANQVEQQLTLYLAGQQPAQLQADIVLANILAGPLQQLAPQLCSYLPPHGLLCLSGILTEQHQAVIDAYQPYCQLDPLAEQEEWCRVTGRRLYPVGIV